MSGQRRVVVTGLGIVSPLGIGWRESWDAALAGTSTARTITRFDPADHACKIACEVRGFDPEDHIDRRAARRMDRASQLAVAAARMAVEDAGLEIRDGGERAGAVISTGNGSSQTFEDNDAQLIARGPGRASPLMVPMTIVNMSAGHVSMQLGLRGPSWVVSTACSSSAKVFGSAARLIEAQQLPRFQPRPFVNIPPVPHAAVISGAPDRGESPGL